MELINRLRGPLIVVNFKTYIEATGKRAVELAKSSETVARDTGVTLVVAPQFTDIKAVYEEVDIPVFSQHLDPINPGPFTGRVLPEAVKSSGAEGSIINHSERRISMNEIRDCIRRCAENDLYSLVCADTADLASEISMSNLDMIAIEPPDLIGTGISVSKARPELITDTVRQVRDVNSRVRILCGAGISTADDVSKALELGTTGVLVASSVVKSKDPRAILSDMANIISDHT